MSNTPRLDYLGNDWAVFRSWLNTEQLETYKRLANTTTKEDETQRLRGRAQFIEMLLDLHNNPTA